MFYITRFRLGELLGIGQNRLRQLVQEGAIPAPHLIPRQGRPQQLWELDAIRLWASAQVTAEGLDVVGVLIRAAGTTLPNLQYGPPASASSAAPVQPVDAPEVAA